MMDKLRKLEKQWLEELGQIPTYEQNAHILCSNHIKQIQEIINAEKENLAVPDDYNYYKYW